MRVNARLDDSYATKLDFLKEATQLCVSDVIKESLDRYYVEVRAEQVRKMRRLDAIVGMAGSENAPADLSSNYKKYVGQIIEEKYPQHGHR